MYVQQILIYLPNPSTLRQLHRSCLPIHAPHDHSSKASQSQYTLLTIPVQLTDQIAASLEAYFWPKFFFDFLTKNFDPAFKPVPIFQTINLLLGLFILAYEWPLKIIAGRAVHASIEFRLLLYPLACLCAVLLYQGTNAGVCYLFGWAVYFWSFVEGEVSSLFFVFLRASLAWLWRVICVTAVLTFVVQVVCARPWSLPRRSLGKKKTKRLEEP